MSYFFGVILQGSLLLMKIPFGCRGRYVFVEHRYEELRDVVKHCYLTEYQERNDSSLAVFIRHKKYKDKVMVAVSLNLINAN